MIFDLVFLIDKTKAGCVRADHETSLSPQEAAGTGLVLAGDAEEKGTVT